MTSTFITFKPMQNKRFHITKTFEMLYTLKLAKSAGHAGHNRR